MNFVQLNVINLTDLPFPNLQENSVPIRDFPYNQCRQINESSPRHPKVERILKRKTQTGMFVLTFQKQYISLFYLVQNITDQGCVTKYTGTKLIERIMAM